MRKLLSILAVFVLLASVVGSFSESAADYSAQTYEFGVYSINEFGNVILAVYGNTFAGLGFEYGDVITVGISGREYRMPVVSSYSDVDYAEMLCCLQTAGDERQSSVVLAVRNGNFAAATGLAEKQASDADPGYKWLYDPDSVISVAMALKGGYAEEFTLRQLQGTTERGDYADLTDEQYANFRMVIAPGIAPYTLYRSSSPVDPSLNRNREADEALNNAGVLSILNLADSTETMKAYPDFSETFYAGRNILALSMSLDFSDSGFQEKMTEGLRFITRTEGPWLIHCKQGKDRTGFICAILECLAGAGADAVISDYMESYVNLYHLTVGEDKYLLIGELLIVQDLQRAFGLPDLRAENVDLAEEARKYLSGIGMSDEEIGMLLEKLSAGV